MAARKKNGTEKAVAKIEKVTALPVPVQETPSVPALVNTDKQMMEAWFEARDYLRELVASRMKEGEHYNVIRGKKSIGFGGSQWLANLPMHNFGMSWEMDVVAMKALGIAPGEGVAVKVTILRADGSIAAQGGGARLLSDDKGPLAQNKCLKMAIKSGYSHGVVMATGLADVFTYDMEEMYPPLPKAQPKEPDRRQMAEALLEPPSEPEMPAPWEPQPSDRWSPPPFVGKFVEDLVGERCFDKDREKVVAAYAAWQRDDENANPRAWWQTVQAIRMNVKKRTGNLPAVPPQVAKWAIAELENEE